MNRIDNEPAGITVKRLLLGVILAASGCSSPSINTVSPVDCRVDRLPRSGSTSVPNFPDKSQIRIGDVMIKRDGLSLVYDSSVDTNKGSLKTITGIAQGLVLNESYSNIVDGTVNSVFTATLASNDASGKVDLAVSGSCP